VSEYKPGNPYAGLPTAANGYRGDASAYLNSILPDEPQVDLDIHDPAQRDQFLGGFNPDPTLTDKILKSFFDDHASLADIAGRADTTLDALTAWLARPDILARTRNFESACAVRLRITALNRLHHAVDACTIILQEFKDSACHEAAIQQGRGGSPSEHIRRDRETARKASQLMLRFATFDPTRPRSTHRNPRALRERTGAAPLHLTHATFTSLPGYTLNFAAPGFPLEGNPGSIASAIPGAAGPIASTIPGAANSTASAIPAAADSIISGTPCAATSTAPAPQPPDPIILPDASPDPGCLTPVKGGLFDDSNNPRNNDLLVQRINALREADRAQNPGAHAQSTAPAPSTAPAVSPPTAPNAVTRSDPSEGSNTAADVEHPTRIQADPPPDHHTSPSPRPP
jgi:hypothetical protein